MKAKLMLTATVFTLLNLLNVPNFAPIGQTVEEIWSFFDFSRWRPSAILNLLYICLDHPRRAFGGLCHCVKFGWNRCSNFRITQVSIYLIFRLENAYSRPFEALGIKIGENWKFSEFYPFRNAITWNWPILRIKSVKSAFGFRLGMRAKFVVTKKEN